MENNNSLNKSFYSYPKSLNHKVMWKKNDKIKTCDLDSNCSELEFSIKQNKLIKHKIFNNTHNIDELEHSNNVNANENFSCIRRISVNSKIITNFTNYDIVIFFLLLTLFIALNFKSRK